MSLPHPTTCVLTPGKRIDLGSFRRAEDGGAPRWSTRAALDLWNGRLIARFDCEDDDPWGTLTRRDDPLWTEEVVELFLAPGAASPSRYFEFEVSPLGTVFDAVVDSPYGNRRDLTVDPGWNCAGLETAVDLQADARRWSAELTIPLRELSPDGIPETWRLNLYRIERPRDGSPPDFSAWSPTFAVPADFHRPDRFGCLKLQR